MPALPYRLTLPKTRRTAVVFASPHSGRDYPQAFLASSVLDENTIRSSEDAFVDLLLDAAPGVGAPLLAATAPRAFVDLNRAADELDGVLIEGLKAGAHNPRVLSGLGVIPRVVAGARPIYSGKITRAEAEARIASHWDPFHACLARLMSESHSRFGEAILIDMHSMPHEAISVMSSTTRQAPEIVLGDRFGASASAEIVDRIEAAFTAVGLRVARNAPFAGAYVTQTYGRPARRRHAVQVEIDRSLYMDEVAIRPNAAFRGFRRLMAGVVAEIAAIGEGSVRLAAE